MDLKEQVTVKLVEDQIDSNRADSEDEVKTECPHFDHIIPCDERQHVLFDVDKEEAKEAEDDDSDMKHLLWDGPEDSDEEI